MSGQSRERGEENGTEHGKGDSGKTPGQGHDPGAAGTAGGGEQRGGEQMGDRQRPAGCGAALPAGPCAGLHAGRAAGLQAPAYRAGGGCTGRDRRVHVPGGQMAEGLGFLRGTAAGISRRSVSGVSLRRAVCQISGGERPGGAGQQAATPGHSADGAGLRTYRRRKPAGGAAVTGRIVCAGRPAG